LLLTNFGRFNKVFHALSHPVGVLLLRSENRKWRIQATAPGRGAVSINR
jgi:hypothetical protein